MDRFVTVGIMPLLRTLQNFQKIWDTLLRGET